MALCPRHGSCLYGKVENAETEKRVLTSALENIALLEPFAMSANIKTHEHSKDRA